MEPASVMRVFPRGAVRSVASLLIAVVCATLLLQNRELKTQLGEARSDLELMRFPEAGMSVPRVAVTGIDGAVMEVGAVGALQVLFFLEPDCSYCQASISTTEYLSARLGSAVPESAFIALSKSGVDTLRRFVSEYRVTYPVARSSAGINAAFRVPGVPILLIVGKDGTVKYTHYGVFDDESLADDVVRSVRRLAAQS